MHLLPFTGEAEEVAVALNDDARFAGDELLSNGASNSSCNGRLLDTIVGIHYI